MKIALRKDDFQQRVIASTLPYDHELKMAKAIFPDLEAEVADDGGLVFYPTSAEEFEEMLAIYKERGLD